MTEKLELLAKYRGCLLGGAIGDALGYPVEFMSYEEIVEQYGKNGITKLELTKKRYENKDIALVSDDTQMTMFTAEGLLQADSSFIKSDNDYLEYVALGYQHWYETQMASPTRCSANYNLDLKQQSSWLLKVKELYSRRAPGNTCMRSIAKGCNGSIDKPINDSKGCGGVMRIAPVGLYFDNPKKAAEIGARVAALTHGHPLGYISAAALTYLISIIIENPEKPLLELVRSTLRYIDKAYRVYDGLEVFLELMVKAVMLSQSTAAPQKCIAELGGGWVAEETLAIAIYCALKYQDSFEAGVRAAVNHSGDSDSTGAVTGNILGAYLGLEKIPTYFLDNLELRKEIIILADDLLKGYPYPEDRDEVNLWNSKYVDFSFCCE